MKLLEELSFEKGKRKKKQVVGVYLIGASLVGLSWSLWWEHLDIPYGFAGIGLLIGVVVVTIVLHEGLHGLLFRLWSEKVKFGCRTTVFGPVFYATSPGSFFTRNQMVLIALAPQALTILALIGLYTTTVEWVQFVFASAAALNLCGGCGDIATILLLSKYPRTVLVEDKLDGVAIYE